MSTLCCPPCSDLFFQSPRRPLKKSRKVFCPEPRFQDTYQDTCQDADLNDIMADDSEFKEVNDLSALLVAQMEAKRAAKRAEAQALQAAQAQAAQQAEDIQVRLKAKSQQSEKLRLQYMEDHKKWIAEAIPILDQAMLYLFRSGHIKEAHYDAPAQRFDAHYAPLEVYHQCRWWFESYSLIVSKWIDYPDFRPDVFTVVYMICYLIRWSRTCKLPLTERNLTNLIPVAFRVAMKMHDDHAVCPENFYQTIPDRNSGFQKIPFHDPASVNRMELAFLCDLKYDLHVSVREGLELMADITSNALVISRWCAMGVEHAVHSRLTQAQIIPIPVDLPGTTLEEMLYMLITEDKYGWQPSDIVLALAVMDRCGNYAPDQVARVIVGAVQRNQQRNQQRKQVVFSKCLPDCRGWVEPQKAYVKEDLYRLYVPPCSDQLYINHRDQDLPSKSIIGSFPTLQQMKREQEEALATYQRSLQPAELRMLQGKLVKAMNEHLHATYMTHEEVVKKLRKR